MMVGMSLYRSVNAILSTNRTFAAVASDNVDITAAKLVYIGLNAVGVAMILYKLSVMGLLPITSADWALLLQPNTPTDYSTDF